MSEAASVEELFDVLQDRFFGKYRAVVTDNNDLQKRGQLQVQVPSVMGDQLIWALPCVGYAGDGIGLYAMPPVGAGVWVEFEGGDPSYPIWVGCFWSDGHIETADASPTIKFWKTDGVTLRIDDEAGTLTIETADGTLVKIGDGEFKVEATEINADANGTTLKLSSSGLDVNEGALTVS
jgi:uncharacterized protein involved in type VI secretion and phage assembly